MKTTNDEYYIDDTVKVLESKNKINELINIASSLYESGITSQAFNKRNKKGIDKNISQSDRDIIYGILKDYEQENGK